MARLTRDLPVVAVAGETVDQLVWRTLGQGSPAVERVLAANPGLAAAGVFLAGGRTVRIPAAADAPSAGAMIQLWT